MVRFQPTRMGVRVTFPGKNPSTSFRLYCLLKDFRTFARYSSSSVCADFSQRKLVPSLARRRIVTSPEKSGSSEQSKVKTLKMSNQTQSDVSASSVTWPKVILFGDSLTQVYSDFLLYPINGATTPIYL